MQTEVLQPWTTIQAGSTVTTVVQEEEEWRDLGDCSAATFWVDVRGVTSTVTLFLASAPTKDEALFLPLVVPVTLTPSATPIALPTIAGAASVAPLSRWVRWSVSSSGGAAWSATFRIRASRSRTPYFSPTVAPGCALWLRSDLGVTQSGGVVSVWADQTGNAGNQMNAQGSPTVSATGFASPIARPAIQTSAGGNYFLPASGVTFAQPDSMILVVQSGGALANAQHYVVGASGASQLVAQAASSTTTLNLNASSGGVKSVTVADLTTPSILQIDWNGASTFVYQNGGVLGAAINPGTQALQLASLGASAAGGFPVTGAFAEVLLFKSVLSVQWRTIVTRYLGARYGIAVP